MLTVFGFRSNKKLAMYRERRTQGDDYRSRMWDFRLCSRRYSGKAGEAGSFGKGRIILIRSGIYIVLGYLCGSVLFARVFAVLLQKGDITAHSADGNPGTVNAFCYGGFWCGIFTLCGDLLKGFIPIYMYLRGTELESCGMELVFIIIAPVVGHIFPFFYRFRGGKGIAVTFGCLLGLYPNLSPALVLAFVFLFFSLVIRITPHYDRTIWTYRCAAVCMFFVVKNVYFIMAFLIIAFIVNLNMLFSQEKEECRVRILWKH
ncbi:MAG: glycerol-3-phosphate acyltransferase [Candidatus Gastranaerophilales bacterium]|nr:glycerol-3-phosphate acyltransferase [Candidatus Gastranaerophilales bacterium]